jgi:hypothetical protein
MRRDRSVTRIFHSELALVLVGALAAPACQATPAPDLGVSRSSSALTWQDLACQLSKDHNPDHMSWWLRIPNEPDLAQIFWHELMPKRDASACSAVVETMFWDRAVPENWAWQNTGMPGWPWNEGGYYTQLLWARAVPDNWGWLNFKLLPGWPWDAGGYYTQKFWAQMVPEDGGPTHYRLGRYVDSYNPCCPTDDEVRDSMGKSYGYYKYWFWENAVPDDWAMRPDIGGWYGGASGGYYKQWLWLHAIPDEWVRQQHRNVGGQSNRGYYLWEFYQNAMSRDYAWKPGLVRNGIPGGAGYYGFYFRDPDFLNMLSSPTRAKYAALLNLAGAPEEPGLGFLCNATGVRKVRDWWPSDTRAVVILTFDNHAWEPGWDPVVKQVLDARDVKKSTWFLTAEPFGADQIRNYDLGNHTVMHKMMNRFTGAANFADLDDLNTLWNQRLGRALDPTTTFNTYRAPLCDGQKTFDRMVLDTWADFATRRGATNLSDSSVMYLAPSVIQSGHVPPWGHRQFMVTDYPYPFRIRPGVVEFPAAYPSDGMAAYYHKLEELHTPGVGGLRQGRVGFALDLWKKAFDDVYAKEGVITMLLHPQHLGFRVEDKPSPSLNELILYMKSKSGVVFTDLEEATRRFNAKY